MRAHGFELGTPAKRLTLRSIREICSRKVFELGREYRAQGRVVDLAVQVTVSLFEAVRVTEGTHTTTTHGLDELPASSRPILWLHVSKKN